MYFSDIPDAIRMTYFLILLMMYMRAIIQRAVLSTATAICRHANRVPDMSPSVYELLLSAVSGEKWPAGRVVWWLLFTVLPPLFSSVNIIILWFWFFGLNGLLLFDFVRLCAAGEVVCSFEGWSPVLDRAGSMIDVEVIVPLRTTDGLSSAADL